MRAKIIRNRPVSLFFDGEDYVEFILENGQLTIKTVNLMVQKEVELSFTLNIPEEQLENAVDSYRSGVAVQKAFPFLDAEKREFIISGLLPTEQEEIFGEAY